MTVQAEAALRRAHSGESWLAQSPEEVAAALGVDPEQRLGSATVTERLRTNGPNALPGEKLVAAMARLND